MVCTIIALLIQFTAPPRAASIADAIPEAVSRRVVTSQSSARPTPESTSAAEGASGETTSGISRALPLVPSENTRVSFGDSRPGCPIREAASLYRR